MAHENAGKLAGGLILLLVVWVGVYWFWPVSGVKVTRDNTESPDTPASAQPQPQPQPGNDSAILLPQGPILPRERPTARNDRPIVTPPRSTEPPPVVEPNDKPAVIPPEFIEHTVQRGDTFESIARKYYGVSGKAEVIAKANPFKTPDRLRAGEVLRVPKDPGNVQGKPVAPQPGVTEYVVRGGDTLGKISRQFYGTSALADAIFEANRDTLASPHELKIGQVLKIPPRPQ